MISSKQPRKQRKFLFTAPLHLRRKILSAHLSKDLRGQYKRRALPIRKGDEVQIMRGENVGKTGKVARVDLKDYKVFIEGITTKRTVGTEVQIPISPSNLKITNLNLDDEMRRKILLRKVKEVKVPEKKPEPKVEKKVEEKVSEKPAEKETKEEKNEIKEASDSKVLGNIQENKEMGSSSKRRTTQKV